jgi:hypothetical protein
MKQQTLIGDIIENEKRGGAGSYKREKREQAKKAARTRARNKKRKERSIR